MRSHPQKAALAPSADVVTRRFSKLTDSSVSKPNQLSPKTQADETFERLRADILSCRLSPGTKLRITDLCAQYGVSLGSVREALSRLGADGLVIPEAQKGYSVTPVSTDDLRQLMDARIKIEILCMENAIEHGGLVWEGEMLSSLHQLKHLPERNLEDPARLDDTWAQAHDQFHEALVAGCNNVWLLRMRRMLSMQAERYRRLSVPLRTSERDVDAEHHQLVTALLARDAGRAATAIADHLSHTTQIILDSIEPKTRLEPETSDTKET